MKDHTTSDPTTSNPTTSNLTDRAIEILKRTRDGDDLSGDHLYLVQEAVNGNLSNLGLKAFAELHARVTSGDYVRPWLHDIEHLTKNQDGYVFWKGHEVEHFSFRNRDEERKAAEELARRCRVIESRGEIPNTSNAVWRWTEPTETAQ